MIFTVLLALLLGLALGVSLMVLSNARRRLRAHRATRGRLEAGEAIGLIAGEARPRLQSFVDRYLPVVVDARFCGIPVEDLDRVELLTFIGFLMTESRRYHEGRILP
jgi:hypothetical protein